jgi:putative Mg2+ transporter-C (MgtC) family protein
VLQFNEMEYDGAMLGRVDILLRLGSALLVGCAIGLNRELHKKPTGMRTLGLVALGSAFAVLAAGDDSNDVSRAIQGVITGVGFLGAGVILQRPTGGKVQGLTTAATIWVTAALGLLCGRGAWEIVSAGALLVLVILIAGGPIEKWCRKILSPDKPDSESE